MSQPPQNPTIELKETAHLYGGVKVYEQAYHDGLTKLLFEPWLIARTPEFKNWFGDWESSASYKSCQMAPILNLIGNEFAHEGGVVLDKVERYYADHWNSEISVKGIGWVSLDRRALENSLSHGAGRYRTVSFAAIPDVLTKGRIVHSEPMRGSADGVAYQVAAPIQIIGKDLIASVLIKSDANKCRLFTHQVFIKDKLQFPRREDGAVAVAMAGKRSVRGSGAMWSVLRDIYAVNLNSVSKQIDPETQEPLPEAIDAFLGLMRAQGVSISSVVSPSVGGPLSPESKNLIQLAKHARRVGRSAASDEVKAQAIDDLEASIKGVTGPGLTAIPLRRMLIAFALRRCSERNLINAAIDHDKATARRFELSKGRPQVLGLEI